MCTAGTTLLYIAKNINIYNIFIRNLANGVNTKLLYQTATYGIIVLNFAIEKKINCRFKSLEIVMEKKIIGEKLGGNGLKY